MAGYSTGRESDASWHGHADPESPIAAAASREVDLMGVVRYANTYREGIDMISSKSLDMPDFGKIVTHRYKGLQEAQKAYEVTLVVKVVIEMGELGRKKLGLRDRAFATRVYSELDLYSLPDSYKQLEYPDSSAQLSALKHHFSTTIAMPLRRG